MNLQDPSIANVVQLKLIHLESATAEITASGFDLCSLLSSDERERASGIMLPERSRQWIQSRVMLRVTLGELLALDPQSIEFELNEFGKPHLSPALIAEVGPFWFNSTHSGEYAAIAVSQVGEVGIDLECVRPVKRLERKASLFLSDSEQQELFALPERERNVAFLRLWVLKEALAKALGGGLQNRTRHLQVSCLPIPHVTSLDIDVAENWQLEEFILPGYIGAVAQRIVAVPSDS